MGPILPILDQHALPHITLWLAKCVRFLIALPPLRAKRVQRGGETVIAQAERLRVSQETFQQALGKLVSDPAFRAEDDADPAGRTALGEADTDRRGDLAQLYHEHSKLHALPGQQVASTDMYSSAEIAAMSRGHKRYRRAPVTPLPTDPPLAHREFAELVARRRTVRCSGWTASTRQSCMWGFSAREPKAHHPLRRRGRRLCAPNKASPGEG